VNTEKNRKKAKKGFLCSVLSSVFSVFSVTLWLVLLLPLSIKRRVSTISSECSIHPRRAVVVFLLEPEESRYDLRWRMFGTPVRVHPMFWIVSVVLGYDGTIRQGVSFVLAWVACVFVSILFHEFGHIWMGRLFGSHGYIVLYSFGGLAIGSKRLYARWQRILVSFAGPLAQFLLLGAVLALLFFLAPYVPLGWGPHVERIAEFLVWINLFWALLNLLPIWPLDGGQIARELCQAVMPERGTLFSLGISMVVSGLLAVHILMASQGRPLLPYVPAFGMLTALFFAMFCISSFLALQAENARRHQWSDDEWT
jgi:Zn-dependent protease